MLVSVTAQIYLLLGPPHFATCSSIFSWPAWWIMPLSLCAWNFEPFPRMAMIFANVCVKLKLCPIVKSRECTLDSRYTHTYSYSHTCFRGWKIWQWWWLWTCRDLSDSLPDAAPHSETCAGRWLCWLTRALTLHSCKYSTHNIPVWACGHRSTVTFRFDLYTSSAIWSPPISRPRRMPAFNSHCSLFPSHCGWLTTTPPLANPPFLPLIQSGRTCHSTVASDWGSTAAGAPWHAWLGPWGCICTIEVHRSDSQFNCGTGFRNKELYLYFIVFVFFVSFLADRALPVGYCNYWRIEHK